MKKNSMGAVIQIVSGIVTFFLIIIGVKNENFIIGTLSLVPFGVFSFYWFRGITKKIELLERNLEKLTNVFNNQKDTINTRERLARLEAIIEERSMETKREKIKKKGQVDPVTMLVIIVIIVLVVLWLSGKI